MLTQTLHTRRLSSLEIQADDNHFGVSLIDGLGENQRTWVGDVVSKTIDDIGKTVGEFNFWNEFEERIIEVATKTQFEITVEAIRKQVSTFLHSEVKHWIHARHHVRTIVVETLGRNLEVNRDRDISGLQGLILPLIVQMITKRDVLVAKMHGRNHTHRKMVAQACFSQHTHTESRLVIRHISKPLVAHLIRKAIVHELYILHVDTSKESIMKDSLVDVGTIHHLAGLRLQGLHKKWGDAPKQHRKRPC